LAVASLKRIPELPEVPAVAELYPGFYSNSWFAFVAPPQTPAATAAKISQAVADVVRMPDVAAWYKKTSMTPIAMSPAETGFFLKKEAERWRKVIISSHLEPK
jgi:tripartite-type tricarboxylate transporter receptor subunit TctC